MMVQTMVSRLLKRFWALEPSPETGVECGVKCREKSLDLYRLKAEH